MTRGHLRRALALALALAFALVFTLVASPGARADDGLAREHFRRGVELYDRKQYAGALAAFQDAYGERPAASIKQNIALCLKRLNRPVEAASAFDEALDEGRDTLEPDTRAAIDRELSDLAPAIVTLHVTVTTPDRAPIDRATLSIAPAGKPAWTVPPDALQRRPVRLAPGTYTLAARAPGYAGADKPPLALAPGPPVDVSFVLTPEPSAPGATNGEGGWLRVQASVASATVRLDGREVAHGAWEGPVSAGLHSVEVAAAGWKTTTLDVTVPSGASVDYPVTLEPTGDAPPAYVAPNAPRPKAPRRFYVAPMIGLTTATYRLSPALGEAPPGGERRSMGGALVAGRFDWFFSRYLSTEAYVALGGMNAEYTILPGDLGESKTTVSHWQLVPALRLTIPQDTLVRFTAASGGGVQGLQVETELASGARVTKKGSGVGWSWLLEAGAQVDLGAAFLEAALVFELYSVRSVRADGPPEDRLLLAAPVSRGALRLGVGIPF